MQNRERYQSLKTFAPVAFFLLSIVFVLVRIATAQSDPQSSIRCEGISPDPADIQLFRCPAKGVTAVLCPAEGSWHAYLEGDYFRCLNEQEFASKTQTDYVECKKTSQNMLYGTSALRGCNTDDVTTRCWYPYELKEGKCVSKQKCPSPNAPIIHFEGGAFKCFSNKEFRSVLQQGNLMQCETPDGETTYTTSVTDGCASGDITTLCPYQYALEDGSCVLSDSKMKCTQSSSPIPYFEGGKLDCLSPKKFGSLLRGGNIMQCEVPGGEIYNTSVASGCNTGDTATNCPWQHELQDNRCVAKPQNAQISREISYVIIERSPPAFNIDQCSTYQIDFEKELKVSSILITAAESVRRESEFANRAFKKSFMEHISNAARAERKAKTVVQKFECTQNAHEATKQVLNVLQGELENVQNDIQLVSKSIAIQNVVIGMQKDIQFADSALRACAQRASKDEAKKICIDFDNKLSVLKKNLRELIEAKSDVSESELILLEEETTELLKRLKAINSRDTKSLQNLQKKKSGEKAAKRKAKKFKSQ